MPFTKIQPQQLQLPTFLSPSGDFTFQNNSTGFNIDLNRELDGSFNFTDSVTVNDGQRIVTSSSTNSYSEYSLALGGTNNEVTGNYNLFLNGVSNTAGSGNYNVIINSESIQLGQSGKYNTAIGGDSLQFGNQTTGAVILADHETAVTNSTNHSLLVSFGSGITFQNGDIYHNGDRVHLKSHLSIDSQHSGIFSGNVLVGGQFQADGSAEIEGPLYVNSQTDKSIFSGDLSCDDLFSNSLTLQGSAEITGNLSVSGIVILNDGTEAMSKGFGSQRFSHQVSNTLTGAGENFFNEGGSQLLYGTVGKIVPDDHIVTGHILTGYDPADQTSEIAYFLLKSAGFTGAIMFDKYRDLNGVHIPPAP